MSNQTLTATLTMDPATQALIRENMTALTIAQSWTIDDADTADAVSEEANKAKALVKVLDSKYKEFIVPANQIIEAARGMFKPAIDDLNAAVSHYNVLLVGWRDREQKRITLENQQREEAARKIRAEAEAKAKAEQARAAEESRQKAEQARREAEARQRAENEAREAAAARQKAIEEGDKQAAKEAAERERKAREEAQARAAAEAKATEQAQAALDQGSAKAEQFTLEASAAASAQPREEMRAVAGTTFREKWVAVPEKDEEARKILIRDASVGRPELLGLLKIDETAIGRMATALKGNFNVPGYKAEKQAGAAKAKGA